MPENFNFLPGDTQSPGTQLLGEVARDKLTAAGVDLRPPPTPEEIAAATPVEAPPTPEEVAAATPIEDFRDTPPTEAEIKSASRVYSPEDVLRTPISDLIKDKEFSPVAFALQNPGAASDPKVLANLREVYRAHKIEGVTGADVLEGVKQIPHAIGSLAKAALARAENFFSMTAGPGPRTDESKKAQGEAAAAMESAAFGIGTMAHGAMQKLEHSNPIARLAPGSAASARLWENLPPSEVDKEFFGDVANAQQAATISTGHGELSKASTEELQKQGINLDPAKIESLTLSDPLTFAAFGSGFRLINAATGTVIGTAANLPAVQKALQLLKPIGKNQWANVGEQTAKFVTGQGARAVGAVASKVGGSISHLGPGAAVMEALQGEFGKAAKTALGSIAGPILKKGGEALSETGRNIVAGGSELPRRLVDLGAAGATTVRDILAGAGTGAGMALAASGSPEETQGLVSFGGAFAAAPGALRAGKEVLSSELVTPRGKFEPTFSPAYGENPALDKVTADTLKAMPEEKSSAINFARELGRKFGARIYAYSTPEQGAQIIADAYAKSGSPMAPDAAEHAARQNGFTVDLTGPDGKPQPVIFLNGGATAVGEEMGHVLERILPPEFNQKMDAATRAQFSDEQWNAVGEDYTKKLLGRDLSPGENWRDALTTVTGTSSPDTYMMRENRAANFDTLFKNRGAEIGTPEDLYRRIVGAIGRSAEAVGVPLVEGKDAYGRPISLESMRASEKALQGVTPKTPEVAPAKAGKDALNLNKATEWLNTKSTAEPEQTQAARDILSAAQAQKGIRVLYWGAKGDPAGQVTSVRPERRAEIEKARGDENKDRTLTEKEFFPYKVDVTSKGPQFVGYSPDNLDANIEKYAEWHAQMIREGKTTPTIPYDVDAQSGRFTAAGRAHLMADVQTFVKNQMSGFTGSGKPIVVPRETAERGFYTPEQKGTPTSLDQGRADLINYLFHVQIPETTTRVAPLHIAGQEVSAATEAGRLVEPVRPRGQYTSEQLSKAGIPEPRGVLEVNPFRQAVEQAALDSGIARPSLIDVSQRLNFPRIEKAVPSLRTEPFGANTLTLSAGFQPEGGEKESIRDPAIRLPSGRVIAANTHEDAIQKASQSGFDTFYDGDMERGFVTSRGNFVDRIKANNIAVDAGQVKPNANRALESWNFSNARQFQPKPEEIAAMKPEEFMDWARGLKGQGFTQIAYDVGKSVESPEQAASLRDHYDAMRADSSKLQKEGNVQDAMTRAAQAQFFREAWEAATGTGSAGEFLRAEQQFQPERKEGGEAEPRTFVIRHGETDYNKESGNPDKIRGHLDIPLNEAGKEDALKTAAALHNSGIRKIFSSDLGRTMDTAIALQRTTGAPIEPTEALRPWKFGPTIEGKPTAEVMPEIEKLMSNPDNVPEGGESFNQFKQRFLAEYHRIQDAHPNDSTAIVTHYRGTKLLDAWRATGVDNDTVDAQVLAEDGGRKPGSFDVLDKQGNKVPEETPATQFQPARKKDENKFLGGGPEGFSKAWILPNGKVEQLGGMYHAHWLADDPAGIAAAKKYGIEVPPFEGTDTEGVREDALKKGFARVNMNVHTGLLTVEARGRDWNKLKESARQLAESNISGIDSMKTILYNDQVTDIVDRLNTKLFDFSDKEKLNHLPFISENSPEPRIIGKEAAVPVTAEPSEAMFGGYTGKPKYAAYDKAGKYIGKYDKFGDAEDVARSEGGSVKILRGQGEQFQPRLKVKSDKDRLSVEAWDKNKKIGSIEGTVRGNRADVFGIKVEPDFQRQGVGSGLYRKFATEAKNKGAELISGAATPDAARLRKQIFGEPEEETPIPDWEGNMVDLTHKIPASFQPRLNHPEFEDRLKEVISGQAGGHTFNPDGSVWTQPKDKPSDIVTLASVNVPAKELNRENILSALGPYSDLLDEPGIKAGIFSFSKGGKPTVSIDLNAVVPQKFRANSTAFAKANDQVAIWDADKSEEVPTGGKGDTKLKSLGEITDALPGLMRGKPVDVPEILRQNREGDAGAEMELPGFGKRTLSTKELSSMTKKAIADYYPESVIPSRRDESIPSAITESPLYRKAGSEEAAVSAFARKLVEFAKEYQDDPRYKSGQRWYSEFTPMLKKTFGADAPIFAELLASTSPQNAPESNFAYAVDALEGLRSGRFNKIVAKFNEGMDKLNSGAWEKTASEGQTPAAWLENWVEKNDLWPRQSNGQKYGISSGGVLQVLARRWLTEARGPKTLNFVKNLLGTGHEATIDLWADRTMRRLGYSGLTDRWRILPKNATGVSEADFAFSQKAFRAAAKQLGMRADSLQGALWFAEKSLWANEGWSRLNLGDYRAEIPKTEALRAGVRERMLRQKALAKPAKAEQESFKSMQAQPAITKGFPEDGKLHNEPAEYIGKWHDGSDAFQSLSIYATHLVRLEKDGKTRFEYDPGKVNRYRYASKYQTENTVKPSNVLVEPRYEK